MILGKYFLTSLLGFSLFFLTISSHLAGSTLAIGCTGYARDQNGKGINGVQISCSGGSSCNVNHYNPVTGLFAYELNPPASDPYGNPGFPYTMTFTVAGYTTSTVTVGSNTTNNGCAGNVTLKQNDLEKGWGCVNHACVFGAGGYPTQQACDTQCAAPIDAYCCKRISGISQCTDSGCFLSETLYVSENACRTDCKQPTPTPAYKYPDLCPDSAPYYSTIVHACCTNKQEGIDNETGNCAGRVKPIGCKPSRTTIYEFKGHTCVPTGKSPVFLCTADEKCSTAIGFISTKPEDFIVRLLQFALPAAIALTVLALLYLGYQTIISRGNPEKLQATKDLAVSVFTGLILLIFSFALLQIIGVGFLGIK